MRNFIFFPWVSLADVENLEHRRPEIFQSPRYPLNKIRKNSDKVQKRWNSMHFLFNHRIKKIKKIPFIIFYFSINPIFSMFGNFL